MTDQTPDLQGVLYFLSVLTVLLSGVCDGDLAKDGCWGGVAAPPPYNAGDAGAMAVPV